MARGAAGAVVEEAGLDSAAWEAQQMRCDVANVSAPLPMKDSMAWPTSWPARSHVALWSNEMGTCLWFVAIDAPVNLRGQGIA